jgi:hypothetical protein
MQNARLLEHMTKRMPFRVKLFIVSFFGALLVIMGAFLMMRVFGDLDANHHFSSVSHPLAMACDEFIMLAMWPAIVYAIIADHASFAAYIVFFFISGLFWAAMVDLFFIICRKYVWGAGR